MLIKIKERISIETFEVMEKSEDKEILLDVGSMMYLTSKEISRLLSLYEKNFRIKLVNANEHIMKSLEVLNIKDVIATDNGQKNKLET